MLPLLGEQGFTSAAAVGIYAMIGPSQVAGRLVMYAADRRLPIGFAGVLATALPVAAMIMLIGLTPGSPISYLFPLLFGAGMGIKTIVQATAAPQFLGIGQYGALQGILSTPVQLVQAASPFAAALLCQLTGNYAALQAVLLLTATASALTFSLAAWRAHTGRS